MFAYFCHSRTFNSIFSDPRVTRYYIVVSFETQKLLKGSQTLKQRCRYTLCMKYITLSSLQHFTYLSAALNIPLAVWDLSSGGQEERKLSSSFIIERMLEADTRAKESSKARLDGSEKRNNADNAGYARWSFCAVTAQVKTFWADKMFVCSNSPCPSTFTSLLKIPLATLWSVCNTTHRLDQNTWRNSSTRKHHQGGIVPEQHYSFEYTDWMCKLLWY